MNKKQIKIIALIIFVILAIFSSAMMFYQFRVLVCKFSNNSFCISTFPSSEQLKEMSIEAEKRGNNI